MQTSKRVLLNTGILYGRMMITMGVSLYSTRLVLIALGSADYGIFNLIAGIIAMLSFLNAAMTTSTQRFLSVHKGKKDINMQKSIFTNSLILHLIIAIIIVAALEIAGFFLFNGFLKIPLDRIDAARAVYHFMSATVFFTIIEAPFTGTLNSHENILVIAAVSIIEILLKLTVAVLLFHVVVNDKLTFYGLLNPCITVFSFLLYATYCLIKYKEASLRHWHLANKDLLKKLASFAGWNLFGSLCTLGKTQGIAIMLNIFFGTVINAAYGIANQIAAQLTFLSATLMQAINPQIMKSHGAGDKERMLRLSMIASKFSFFLMAMVTIPCIFEMKAILTFWLKLVPNYTVIFCDLILVSILINQLTIGLQSTIQATGKIKHYQMVVGSIIILNVPIAYIILKAGFSAYVALVSFSVVEVMACTCRLYFAKTLAGLSVKTYFRDVIIKEAGPIVILVIYCFFATKIVFNYSFLLTIFSSILVFCTSIYFIGLNEGEKFFIKSTYSTILNKFKPSV
jgi:O-antigen/teichoic acid export membrane protein